MDKLNLFLPIKKVDESARTVSGLLSAEVADKSGEIMDYESGKPEFEKWSKDAEKRSGGKSLGNVRAMHGNVAAGKLTQLFCDDTTKSVQGTAKIVDDAEWKKVLEGVYTGFSIGGSYKKKWKDEENPEYTRFTPELSEVSIVDNPCVTEAVFELIRADGATEMRKFKQPEPTIEAPAQVWLAKDGSTYAKKEDALKKNKELSEAEAKENDPTHIAIQKLTTAIEGLESDIVVTDDTTLDKALKGRIKKGLLEVARGACLIQELEWLATTIEFEQEAEKDDSTQPEELKSIISTLCTWLVGAVTEECAELTESEEMEMAAKLPEDHASALLKHIKPEAKIYEALSKAGARHSKTDMAHLEEMKGHHEKLGAALDGVAEAHEGLTKCMGKAAGDKEMATHLEALDTHHAKAERAHDAMEKCMGNLGYKKAETVEDLQKSTPAKDEIVTKLTADNDDLQKKLNSTITVIESLTKRVEEIAKQPARTTGALYAVHKGHELNPPGGQPNETIIQRAEPEFSPILNRI